MTFLPCLVAGEAVPGAERKPVRFPFTGEVVGEVGWLSIHDVDNAIERMLAGPGMPLRHERWAVLERARALLAERAEEFAWSIVMESGLAIREARYEVGRALDVLRFAAVESVREDGQVLCGDIAAGATGRRIFTLREPHRLALAITPFNHPLNQVVHKLAPAIAAGTPMILKPSERTPMTALRFGQLLIAAGLPGTMLSVVLGDVETVVEPLVSDPRVDVVTFTGGTAIGKRIASLAGYKKVCLELGGCSPLIVLPDADLDLAAQLAAEGCFRNSGQRCTSVRRILADRLIVDDFTDRFVAKAGEYVCGDPRLESTRVGTVITEASATLLEGRVRSAVDAGARCLLGGTRDGALLSPTVLGDVPRDAELVRQESFGPVAPILAVDGLDDAIRLANDTPFGLSSAVVGNAMDSILRVVREVRAGTVNVNQIPGYRTEMSPFGGVKDSGLGVKEGVVEAARFLGWTKTFSLPW